MNYLKKKIKSPGTNNNNSSNNNNKDLEDDLYDEYVVEAPPHPSELLALGVNPDEIDINNPDKLRELYRKAKEEGKDKQINSVLLAKQREKEEIEEKKKTKEEWKFFDSLTARVEQAVKDSQKTLDQLKDTNIIEKLSEPEYELKLSADEVFKSSSNNVKLEKSANQWIDFGEGRTSGSNSNMVDDNSSNSNNNRRASDIVRNPFSASGRTGTAVTESEGANKTSRLYHRNMSSFEAASLHLEQQQQLQQQGINVIDIIDGPPDSMASNDLIAQMTADFKSAIETNDKKFDATTESGQPLPPATTNPFENFDPFETIVDDDISFPSPTAQQQNKAPSDDILANPNYRPASFFNPFETVIDKDALTSPVDDGGPELSDEKETELGSRELYPNEPTKVPNPTPMHKPSTNQTESVETDQLQPNDNEQNLANSSETITHHHIKPASLHEEGSTSIESVIENSSARRQVEETPVDETTTQKEEPTGEAANDSTNGDSGSRFKKPAEYCAVPRPKPSPRRFEGMEQVPMVQPLTKTPLKKRQQNKKKPSFQEDSSESSDDDDRIQIVIKARPEIAREGQEEASAASDKSGPVDGQQPLVVPLLPPPPSKSLIIKQNREKEIKILNELERDSARSVNKVGSFEDLPIGKPEKTDKAETGEIKVDEQAAKKHQDDDYEEEEEDVEEDDGKFVIPMTLPRDGDGDDDEYGKPDTPLYDEDTSYVLEEYPAKYEGNGWEMMLRYPPKKKLTSNRFWKKIFVRLALVPDTSAADKKKAPAPASQEPPAMCVALQIFDKPEDKKAMQEIPIQATYTVSEISGQQFDQFGKIFTIKLQYIFYKERVGVRQGQLARFIHSGHIGSSTTSGGHGVDPISIGAIKRMGAPIEHSPQVSQIIKLGCCNYADIKQFKNCLEDYLFKMPIHRDRALTTYKTEEVQMAVRDETYIELNHLGTIIKQLARVRLFFLSFLNGMPQVEVGVNDYHRQGREVVGRMDILPVVTEEWIRLESCELHQTVDEQEFANEESRLIRLCPPDATFFELLRFRVRPPRNRELPLQITANMSVTRTKVSINCEVMVPGCVSRKHGQIPCENIAIRVQIPDCWIYFFREEKHFRMGSKKSVNRRPGKVKGIERFLGGGSGLQDVNDDTGLIEVTSGQAKYEHHHGAIVWRAARWPKESQSAYVQNTMKIRLPLTAYDKMPDSFSEYVHVEYTMPATTVSHTTLRSISVAPCDDEPPEKYVKYSAKYEYKVKMKLSVNINKAGADTKDQEFPDSSPIVIMKQPDLDGDLHKEEDVNDDDDDSDEACSGQDA